MLDLAKELRNWVAGQPEQIDSSAWREQFRERAEALAEKAKRDHAEVDPWLGRIPSAAPAVQQIADALERMARRLPQDK